MGITRHFELKEEERRRKKPTKPRWYDGKKYRCFCFSFPFDGVCFYWKYGIINRHSWSPLRSILAQSFRFTSRDMGAVPEGGRARQSCQAQDWHLCCRSWPPILNCFTQDGDPSLGCGFVCTCWLQTQTLLRIWSPASSPVLLLNG